LCVLPHPSIPPYLRACCCGLLVCSFACFALRRAQVRETSRDAGMGVVANPVRRLLGALGVPKWAGAIPKDLAAPLDGVILESTVSAKGFESILRCGIR